MKQNLLVILGPTASGKTSLAVSAAQTLGGEIISADSRQVFRRMDIGSGKDLSEYGAIPYHMIDILEPGAEFSVFAFQHSFVEVFAEINTRNKLPILAGGTGLYLDSILRDYNFSPVPEDPALRQSLEHLATSEILERLQSFNKIPLNKLTHDDHPRLVRALEIAIFEATTSSTSVELPRLRPVVFGIKIEREILRKRITERLKSRLEQGMVEEVRGLLAEGVPRERLESYGLEYRFISRFIHGEMSRNDMFQKLNSAIHDFAKRQDTWFRKMERKGVAINWLDHNRDMLSQLLEIWRGSAS